MRFVRLSGAGLAALLILSGSPSVHSVLAQGQGVPGERTPIVRTASESMARIAAREDDPGDPPTRRAQLALTTSGAPSFDTVHFSETSALPPDGSAAAGPTQLIVVANGRIRSFTKAGAPDAVVNVKPDTFFATVRGAGATFGGRIRFDRHSSRWFITMATTAVPGRIVMASSNSATIAASTVWSFSSFDDTFGGADCTTDAPTLGIDEAALYIGVNQFCTAGTTFAGSSGYVVRKSSAIDGASPVVTAFHNLTGSVSGAGPVSPQGVSNDDSGTTAGYFLGTDNVSFGTLMLRRVSNPAGTPTISANIPIAVAATSLPIAVRHLGNADGANGYLSANDDRLAAVTVRNGRAWIAHAIGVTHTGAVGSATRDGVRWYEIGSLDGTPAVLQSGTIHDPAAPGSVDERNHFNASLATNPAGRTLVGFTFAGTRDYAGVAAADRTAADAAGTMQATAYVLNGGAAYNPPGTASASGRKWGGYSETFTDECDGTTLWSLQQYADSVNSYALRAIKVQTDPPPVLVSASPATVRVGQASIDIVLTASASGSRVFFDAPAGFACRLAASIPGITVNSVTRIDATSVRVNVSTVNGTAGRKTVTVTNPDGQSTAASVLTVLGGPVLVIETPQPGGAGQPLAVRGFALDGSASSGAGIDAVHVYATAPGGAPIFLGAAAYGQSRPDISQQYGSQFAPSGFTLRATEILTPGPYTITAYGHSTASNTFAITHTVSVTLKAPSAPAGVVDTPADDTTVAGEMAITGWAVDEAGVKQVDIVRSMIPAEGNGQVFVGQAVFSRGARPDVQSFFPAYVDSDAAGWGYMVLTNMLPSQGNGTFTFHAYATNYAGQRTLLGSKRVNVANATSLSPFGSIDTPGQGETVSGVVVNFGWALARPGRTIPLDGSTIDVYIDNALVGHPTYNNYRVDIATLFPGLANSNGAVGFYVIDTRTMTDGIHSMFWIIRDDAGQSSGVGSRYFRVQNGS